MGKIVVSYGWTKINPLIYKGFLVRETGLEPASAYCTHEPESCASANSAIPAWNVWAGVDSNHRSVSRQIYSLLPLATREPTHTMDFPLDPKGGAGDGTRTRNLLITNQLLCQLSYASTKLYESPSTFLLKGGDPEGARTLDLQRDRLAL